MSAQPQDFAATVRLVAPRLSLASCVRAYITRSTLGRPLLPPEQRLNRFPATMHCGITWLIRGSSLIVEPAPEHPGEPLPPVMFVGPQTRPSTTYNPGPVQVFMVVLFPQALHALTGIDLSRVVNRISPLAPVIDGAWLDMSQQVMAAGDDDDRVLLVERFLEPMWRAARARGTARGGVLGDSAHALAAHAAAAGWGRSARSLERRIKSWAGQPLRTLRRMSRVEQSFVEARGAMLAGTLSWADVAARGGYADQPHLCREVREVTGLSPTELARKAREDESYWVYRIWS
jgi:AraC-like DNA-binding protein